MVKMDANDRERRMIAVESRVAIFFFARQRGWGASKGEERRAKGAADSRKTDLRGRGESSSLLLSTVL